MPSRVARSLSARTDASTAGDAPSRACACASRVGEAMTRKMTIAESVRACAVPHAKVLAHRTLRDGERRMDAATLRDVEKTCEGVIAWASEDGRAATIASVLEEIESRLWDLEGTLAAGWRGTAFEEARCSDANERERAEDAFHSVRETRYRSADAGALIEEWTGKLLSKLEPEENFRSVIEPMLLLRAYEILIDRQVVNDEAVERMVNSRLAKWQETWREHATQQKRETGRAPTHDAFVQFMKTFLAQRLPAFANSINESSFKFTRQHDTSMEAAFKADDGADTTRTSDTEDTSRSIAGKYHEVHRTIEKAVQAVRAAKNARDVQALLGTTWVREMLVDAPKFVLPPVRPAIGADNGAQMVKDWQREEGFVLRTSKHARSPPSTPSATASINEGLENLQVDPLEEVFVSTGPFRVHFMQACADVERALIACKTCEKHNPRPDEVREACVKGTARILLVSSRTLRSGDCLDFVHNLFGSPPGYTVNLVDPAKARKLIREHSTLGSPIVIEINPVAVTVRCVDIFTVTKHYFAEEVKSIRHTSVVTTNDGDTFEPWACVALETTQTLRVVDDGSLKLIKQRIAVDKMISQYVLNKWHASMHSCASPDRSTASEVRVSSRAFAP